MSLKNQTEDKMKAAIEHLKEELKKIRTGHANPGMVENILIEVYGAGMRLKEIASITTPESRQLLITPYDIKNASVIGKGIEKANMGFNPIVDGHYVRLNIPPMDKTIRQEMVKLCQKKREEAKISIRNERRAGNEALRKQKNEGLISEDIEKKLEKEIQELTDKYCKVSDDICAQKEKEVSTI